MTIGNEKLKIYYEVQNEEELYRAFTAYEKLFNFQKNILETKRNLYDEYLLNSVANYAKNKQILVDLDDKEVEERKRDEEEAKRVGDNIDVIDMIYEKRIKEIDERCQSLEDLNKEKSKKF